jgi:putative addiction module killer protein
MQISVEEYIREDNSNPFKKWFDSLDSQAAVKVTTAISRMEQGNLSNVKWFDGMGEYVIDWGPGYRIYFARHGDRLIILFGGGTKKRQQKDIDKATKLHEEYITRNKAHGTNKRFQKHRR